MHEEIQDILQRLWQSQGKHTSAQTLIHTFGGSFRYENKEILEHDLHYHQAFH